MLSVSLSQLDGNMPTASQKYIYPELAIELWENIFGFMDLQTLFNLIKSRGLDEQAMDAAHKKLSSEIEKALSVEFPNLGKDTRVSVERLLRLEGSLTIEDFEPLLSHIREGVRNTFGLWKAACVTASNPFSSTPYSPLKEMLPLISNTNIDLLGVDPWWGIKYSLLHQFLYRYNNKGLPHADDHLEDFINIANFLMSKGLSIETENGFGERVIHTAAHEPRTGNLIEFLAKHADVNARSTKEYWAMTSLHPIIKAGHYTPLHSACIYPEEKRDNIIVLLAHGADPSIPNGIGITPLDMMKTKQQNDPNEFYEDMISRMEDAITALQFAELPGDGVVTHYIQAELTGEAPQSY